MYKEIYLYLEKWLYKKSTMANINVVCMVVRVPVPDAGTLSGSSNYNIL